METGPTGSAHDLWDPDPAERGWNPQPSEIAAGDKPGLSGQAIMSVVFGVLGILLGIPGLILAIAAIRLIRRGEKRGLGLAITGLVINALWIVGIVVVGALLIIARVSVPAQTTSPGMGSNPLEIGDCIATLDRRSPPYAPAAVPCTEPHQGEVFAIFKLKDELYPRYKNIDFQGRLQCGQAELDRYAGRPAAATTTDVVFLYPSESDWAAGSRSVVCVVHHTMPRSGSLRNASASP